MEPTVFDNDDEKFTNVIFKTRHKYMEFIYMSNYNLIDGFQFLTRGNVFLIVVNLIWNYYF